jgi:hypothetical protein
MEPLHSGTRYVFFDNNVTDRFAEYRLNPVRAIEGTEFIAAYTPDLRVEYEAALRNQATADRPLLREILGDLLAKSLCLGVFGFDGQPFGGFDQGLWASKEQADLIESVPSADYSNDRPRKRTDIHLVALAQHAIVVTDNSKEGHWRSAPPGLGVVLQWKTLLPLLRAGQSLPDILGSIASGNKEISPEP